MVGFGIAFVLVKALFISACIVLPDSLPSPQQPWVVHIRGAR